MLALEAPQTPTFYFIGVSTGQSSIMRVFPDWATAWGLDASIKGIDIPLGAEPQVYRQVVQHIRSEPQAKGALVTTHKLDLYAAARDLFDGLDPRARCTAELSCISKRGSALWGHAKDPLTAGLALEQFLPEQYWHTTDAAVLCLGAGGAALAISLYLSEQTAKPRRLTLIDISKERLEHIRAVHASLASDLDIQYLLHHSVRENDALLAALPAGSLVINATGMGKDRPGSPLSDDAVFPKAGFVWELNYRGSLDFLRQAQQQAATRGLQVEDGWVYFLHGWTQVIAEVFDAWLSPTLFRRLDAIAASYRR